MSKKNQKDDFEMFHGCGLYIPTRTIFVGSESSADASVEHDAESGVDHAMAERLIKNLHMLDSINNEPITIIMDNVGGDEAHGMAIYGAIKSCKSEVVIKVFGQAASMGAIILQAASRRVLDASAKIMIHYGYVSVSGEALTVYKIIEEYKKSDRKMESILLGKIQERVPDFSLSRLRKMLSNDTTFDAKEAVNMGLADEIEGE